MTSDLQQTRYDQLVRRVGGIIGPGSKVAEALSELFPMIDVENVPSELLLLSGTRLGVGSALLVGVVAETPKIQLFNPAESNQLVTVTAIIASTGAVEVIEIDSTSVAIGAAVGGENFRDTRLGVATTTVAQVRVLSDAGGLPGTIRYRVLGNVPNALIVPNDIAVLAPGTGLTVGLEAQDGLLYVTFFWRERLALESELNLPGG